jgi:hypothetical protein
MTLDRRTQTGQSVQAQAEQDREDRMPGNDTKDPILGTTELQTRAMEQNSWDMTGRTG